MQTTAKTLLAFFVAFLLAFTLTPLAAYADDENANDNSETYDDDTGTVLESTDDPQSENSYRYVDGELLTSEQGVNTDSEQSSAFSATKNADGNTVFNWFDQFSKGYYTGTNAYKGIDVSRHNGTINWAKVKAAGVDYAIIRCGYGQNSASQDDSQWLNNVKGCIANDIPFGVYIYSYATNTTKASSEADHVLRCLKNAGLDASDVAYPVYFDMEDSSTIGCDYAAMATAFCKKIEAAGYTPGVYANASWFNTKLTASCFNTWTKWVAQWNASIGLTYSGLSNFTSGNGMWQFSDYGTVPGVGGETDLDYTFMEPIVVNYPDNSVTYRAHVQNTGWQRTVANGATAGTTGKSYRMEAMKISLQNQPYSGSIQYKTHIQNIGWESSWSSDGAITGTTGKSLRLEAIQIKLTGQMADNYDIYYRVHAQDVGWMGWAKNGESAGTAGYSRRLEAIQIQLVEKGGAAPGSTPDAFRQQ